MCMRTEQPVGRVYVINIVRYGIRPLEDIGSLFFFFSLSKWIARYRIYSVNERSLLYIISLS